MKVQSQPVKQYCRCLVQLQQLIKSGQSSSDEADGLRNWMDAVWERMTPAEKEHCATFSATLSKK